MADIPAGTNAGTILVVDDEGTNRMLMKALLSSRGYQVVEAESGEQALEILESSKVDVVLMDVMMPGIDGIEACRRIRRRAEWIHLPIIIVTSLTDRETRIKGKEAGCDDFLNKPVDDLELLARVHNLVLVNLYHENLKKQHERLETLVAKLSAELREALARLEKGR